MRFLTRSLASLAGFCLSASPGFADLTLRLQEGANPVIEVVDNGSTDQVPQAGVIRYQGPLGTFVVNAVTGLENLPAGSQSAPRLQISSFNSSVGSGTLVLQLSDSDFGPTYTPAFTNIIGGATDVPGGTVAFNTYLSADNQMFAGAPIASLGPLTGSFNASTNVSGPSLTESYALTLEVIVEHSETDSQNTSFSAYLITEAGCPTPEIEVSASEICQGDSVVLTATEVAGASYLWMPGGETTRSITVSPSDTTEYTVTVTGPGDCVGIASATVTVNPLPTVTVNSTEICLGETATLTATATPGATITWDNGMTGATITVSPSADTTYTATVTTASGCSAMASGMVTVNPGICEPATFNLTGGDESGGNPNARTYSANGVNVRVTAFSRSSGGDWDPAYVAAYSGGLGVIDASEDGGSPEHTVDNHAGENYLLFEFSQPVVVSGAYLGWVYNDSDLSVRIGTFDDPYNNHLTLSDAVLAGFGYGEENNDGGSTRLATFNAGEIAGNALIIAASLTDDTPDDFFKVKTLEVCIPRCFQPVQVGDFVWNDLNKDGIQDTGEPGIGGVSLSLTGTTESGVSVNATTTTDGNGAYLFANLQPGTYEVDVDSSNFDTGGPLAAFSPSPVLAGGDTAADSNPSPASTTPAFLPGGSSDLTLDFGFHATPPPPPCVAAKFDFTGSSSTDGKNGNIRTYTVNGVSVKVSAFSRSYWGHWEDAYLGAYSGGLGVTDPSEGGGYYNRHTVDNDERFNFVLFEFSQPVTVNRAYLGYVVDDSDLTIWLGTADDPFNNHLSLSDSILGAMHGEHNSTYSSKPRWASFNEGELTANVLVIAASPYDCRRRDAFKIEKLEICAPPAPPVENATIGDLVWEDSNANGIQDAGEQGVDGVKVELYRCDNSPVASTETSGGGLYSFTVPPGDYYVKFSQLPSDYVFSPSNSGGDSDPNDSDANSASGRTDCTTLASGENDPTWDAGIHKPEPPEPPQDCVPTRFVFDGHSSTDGDNGNIRMFSENGVSVRVSAFSREKHDGDWREAYLGMYSGGLGVTDSSEGNGYDNMHTVDNVGRDNFVLFEFSQPVVVNKAFLGYVVADSDLSVWIGNAADPYNNHLSLSDSLLAGMQGENNETTSGYPRWAEFNGGELAGNVLVIAASPFDGSPDDQFKIEKLDICGGGADPSPAPWDQKDIGEVAKAGGSSYDSGTRTFTVKGSGEDIWNYKDEFRFVYQAASGDCRIVARVKSVQQTDGWAKAGVMIRDSLASSSKHASAFITPSNGAAFQYRDSSWGASGNRNETGPFAPYWVAIVREGNTFKAYRSDDGADWNYLGSEYIPMGSSVYIGLAVTSHNDGTLCEAEFDNVFVDP